MTSVLELLQEHPQWPATLGVIRRLNEKGHRALLAGGCVRDALRARPSNDLDVATSATPDEVIALFEKTVQVGKSFGVVRVLVEGADLEVATFRRDGPSVDGRHPESVEFSDEKEDALRRDFTVNALFFDPLKNEVLDYVKGLEDLKRSRLATVGDPSRRFEEDRLRILRAVRFSVQLRFEISEETWREILRTSPKILSVSRERIRDELAKMLKFRDGSRSVRLLKESGLWRVLFPELELEGKEDLLASLLSGGDGSRISGFARLLVPWAAAPALKEVISRLRLSKAEEKAVQARLGGFVRFQEFWPQSLGEKILRYEDPDFQQGFDLWEEVHGKDSRRQALHREWERRRVDGGLPPPFLGGDDVKGRVEGQRIGEVLREAYRLQLEERILSRAQALTWFSEWTKLHKKG